VSIVDRTVQLCVFTGFQFFSSPHFARCRLPYLILYCTYVFCSQISDVIRPPRVDIAILFNSKTSQVSYATVVLFLYNILYYNIMHLILTPFSPRGPTAHCNNIIVASGVTTIDISTCTPRMQYMYGIIIIIIVTTQY